VHRTLKDDLEAALREPHNTLILVGTGVSIGATGNERCASWRGLIEDGIDFCLKQALVNVQWADLRRQQLTSGHVDELLGAAEALQRALGGPRGGYYHRWLEDSVGSLKLKVRDVVDVLGDFEGPLATTNYDGLLEEAIGRKAVTWKKTAKVERLLRGDKKGIRGPWAVPANQESAGRDQLHSGLGGGCPPNIKA